MRAITLVAVVGCALFASVSAMGANLLTDPGFESNPLTTDVNSLGNFPGYQGVWGQENSTIVGVDSGVTPAGGVKQLRMDITGGVATQAFQTVDVSSFAASIDAGNAVLNASALFNANLPAAAGGVYISYFTGNTYGTIFGPLDQNVFTLDSTPGTWEAASVSVPVPVNTRWVLFQVAYTESSLLDSTGVVGSGFVDDAFLEIRTVPAPGAAALLGMGGLAAMRRRRR